ncbi:hypothetical protein ACFY1U_48775 [Streptomyces sp. NPDC001351]|uniref:hypothetical protein n=1 Tax=Streptomyces sp. NPDC001351 TaxID=3364564 RepID=UPI0036B44F03
MQIVTRGKAWLSQSPSNEGEFMRRAVAVAVGAIVFLGVVVTPARVLRQKS